MSTQPIHVDLPHKLGRTEARRRIADNIHKLTSFFPGGAAVTHEWQGDRLDLVIAAMGQSAEARLEVEDALVRVHVALPGLLAMMARPIEAALRSKGSELLLEDRSKK
ncbi:polyhydroxyalkanoic acid system family protein [Sphingomonas sp. LHG3406-1]|uniref:polyhydroxyalkanoic acid system family protein n=1 Tax=Sphingomonas sp. LHG3406-1 TaxID=2804617 RepID=UPI0026346997|nr:polyhydroxyalkanoic acid system family protein [Sphingomonas sp. LHG3406-1]